MVWSGQFPAGFGWQGASVLAEHAGLAADGAGFALATGAGDATGVLLGHTGYFALKKLFFDQHIDLAAQAHTGVLLAGAAFCAGSTWQPCVNLLQSATTLGFSASALATGVACGTMFLGGLRLGRQVWPAIMAHVERPTYANLKADIGLSIAIGGATGAFVGTDVSYGDANWLRGAVGVEDAARHGVGGQQHSAGLWSRAVRGKRLCARQQELGGLGLLPYFYRSAHNPTIPTAALLQFGIFSSSRAQAVGPFAIGCSLLALPRFIVLASPGHLNLIYSQSPYLFMNNKKSLSQNSGHTSELASTLCFTKKSP